MNEEQGEVLQEQDAPIEEPVVEEEAQTDPALEQEARSMGWVPKDQFKGNPDDWRDADEFVRRGKELLPIVNSQLKRVRAEKEELEGKLTKAERDFQVRMQRIERMNQINLQRQKERLFYEYNKQKEAAVEQGDIEKYHALDEEQYEAIAALDQPDYVEQINQSLPQDPRDAVPPNWRKAIESWLPDNEWFHDPEMGAVAAAAHDRFRREQPGLTPAENLMAVKDYVAKRFPEKFGKQNAQQFSRVEGGPRGGFNSKSMYARLPAEAKRVCDSELSNWLEKGETAEKDGAKARERYAKIYFEQPGV